MWQLQWMLQLIPDSVLSLICWAIIVAGLTGVVASWLGRFVPFYGRYAFVLKPIGIVLLVLGVWMRGGLDVEEAWRRRAADFEQQLAQAREQSGQVNTVVETRVVTQTQVIKEKADKIIEYVDRPAVANFDKNCPLPKEAIEVHNEAARMNQAIEEFKKGAKK